MSAQDDRYVPTSSIKHAVQDHETDVLTALSIPWQGGREHIRCPYPDHADEHPSWRWDGQKARASCTCSSADSIFDVLMKVEDCSFAAAKLRVADIIGRGDLIRCGGNRGARGQPFAAANLLNPPTARRDDNLVVRYLAHRLGVGVADVPIPETPVAGWSALAYFDPPAKDKGKPVLVGRWPCAVFGTVRPDGKQHVHRIYLEPGVEGKADLGNRANGHQRDPKKSATGENTAGCAVLWGDVEKAPHIILCEGIETGAAIALALTDGINAEEVAVAAGISAAGLAAFQPWPATKGVTVAPDRDEDKPPESRGYRHGERAARKFAHRHHDEITVDIALPGQPGEKIDWLDVLECGGAQAVIAGLGNIEEFVPDVDVDDDHADSGEDDALLDELAALSPFLYERRREAAAKEMGVRVSVLDREVEARRPHDAENSGAGRSLVLPDPEPWEDAVDGTRLLDDLVSAFGRYLALPDHAAEAMALWVLHAHALDVFSITPRLAITSPEKGCGKTTTLAIIARLVPRPLPASNVTAAVIFRTVELAQPTLLVDEADTFLANSDELRGVLNSGHYRPMAQVIRTTGEDHEPRSFSTWAAAAVAQIGRLPPTLEDRSIIVSMRRRRPDEQIERFRIDRADDLDDLASMAARWAADNLKEIRGADPLVPEEMQNRVADNWRPLLAIADCAGGDWPDRARKVARGLSAGADDASVRVMLLADIRAIFDDAGTDRLPSVKLCEALAEREDRPWPEWRNGKPITARQLAKLLAAFGIAPQTVHTMSGTPKGYKFNTFADAFSRYLPPTDPQHRHKPQKTSIFNETDPTQEATDVADRKSQNPKETGVCGDVADGKGGNGEEKHVDADEEANPPDLDMATDGGAEEAEWSA